MSWSGATLVAGTVTAGLMAGLFAAFSYAVMPGLARTDDATFVAAMQRINGAILNPVFGLCFGGALAFTALALLLRRGEAGAGGILAGLLLYAAVLVVTFAVNVPLNNRLDAATRDPRPAPGDRRAGDPQGRNQAGRGGVDSAEAVGGEDLDGGRQRHRITLGNRHA